MASAPNDRKEDIKIVGVKPAPDSVNVPYVHTPVPDAGLFFHLEEIRNLELTRIQMEPTMKVMRDKLPKMKKIRPYTVTHIDNPHDFYIKYADVEFPVELLDYRLQNYYNNPRNLVKLKYDPAFDVKLYLWRYAAPDGDARWERVRVFARNRGARICRIFLIDVGVKEVASYGDLYELNPEFCASEPRAIRVYLLDTERPNDGWSQDAIEEFKKIALQKEYKGIGLRKFSEVDDSEFLEHCERYGVILLTKTMTCTLNAEVCKLGIAEAAGYASGRLDMLDDYDKNADSRTCDFDVAKLTAILSDEKVASALELPAETASKVLTDVERERADWDINQAVPMPKPIKSRVFRGVCFAFLNPSCFYVMLYEKIPLYEAMITYMDGILGKINTVEDPSVIKPGTFLLILRTDEPTQSVHRAVAKEAPKLIGGGETKNYFVKVFLIDLGRALTTKVCTVRLLPENLCKIPPFAYRVHYSPRNIRPSNGISWSSSASNNCRRACAKGIPEGLCYYWRHSKTEVLELGEFDAEINFDMTKQKWIVKPPRSCGSISAEDLAVLKSNPFFRQLLNSVGVDLSFEIEGPPNTPYMSARQRTLADLLKEKEDTDYM